MRIEPSVYQLILLKTGINVNHCRDTNGYNVITFEKKLYERFGDKYDFNSMSCSDILNKIDATGILESSVRNLFVPEKKKTVPLPEDCIEFINKYSIVNNDKLSLSPQKPLRINYSMFTGITRVDSFDNQFQILYPFKNYAKLEWVSDCWRNPVISEIDALRLLYETEWQTVMDFYYTWVDSDKEMAESDIKLILPGFNGDVSVLPPPVLCGEAFVKTTYTYRMVWDCDVDDNVIAISGRGLVRIHKIDGGYKSSMLRSLSNESEKLLEIYTYLKEHLKL